MERKYGDVVKKGVFFILHMYDKYLGIDGAPSVIRDRSSILKTHSSMQKSYFFEQLLHLQVLFFLLYYHLVNGHVVVVGFTE